MAGWIWRGNICEALSRVLFGRHASLKRNKNLSVVVNYCCLPHLFCNLDIFWFSLDFSFQMCGIRLRSRLWKIGQDGCKLQSFLYFNLALPVIFIKCPTFSNLKNTKEQVRIKKRLKGWFKCAIFSVCFYSPWRVMQTFAFLSRSFWLDTVTSLLLDPYHLPEIWTPLSFLILCLTLSNLLCLFLSVSCPLTRPWGRTGVLPLGVLQSVPDRFSVAVGCPEFLLLLLYMIS